MKIAAQTLSNLSQIIPTPTKFEEFGFEKWLVNPERQNTGDEYYWLHQHQLQNSALSFNFDNQANKAKTRKAEENAKCRDSRHENLVENKQSLLSNEDFPSMESSNPSPSLENEFSPLFKLLSKLISTFIPQRTELNNQRLLKFLAKNERVEHKTFSHRVIFKNYQLFIEAKEAELSLNGLNLSKKQLIELNQILKHWLQNKGIKLQKIVINGVVL